MGEVPAILVGAVDTERRVLKVSSFEVDLFYNNELLDPDAGDRIALRLEATVLGAAPKITLHREIQGKSVRFFADTEGLFYDSDVVPGSPEVKGFERAPRQLMLDEAMTGADAAP